MKRGKYRVAGIVGERIVTDALTPEQALADLADAESGRSSKLLGKGFTQMGTGIAFERTPEGFRVVWVQGLARPTVMPTTADSTRDGE